MSFYSNFNTGKVQWVYDKLISQTVNITSLKRRVNKDFKVYSIQNVITGRFITGSPNSLTSYKAYQGVCFERNYKISQFTQSTDQIEYFLGITDTTPNTSSTYSEPMQIWVKDKEELYDVLFDQLTRFSRVTESDGYGLFVAFMLQHYPAIYKSALFQKGFKPRETKSILKKNNIPIKEYLEFLETNDILGFGRYNKPFTNISLAEFDIVEQNRKDITDNAMIIYLDSKANKARHVVPIGTGATVVISKVEQWKQHNNEDNVKQETKVITLEV